MTRLALLLAVLPSATGWAQTDPADERPFTEILTADQIRAAGIGQLGELVRLATDWYAITIDGFAWSASPRGLSSFQRQTWRVMVDGQPVELGVFGSVDLSRLPVTLGEIERVEIVSAPRLHGGVYAEGGLIHIHRARPEPGVSAAGLLAAGNETGDPGPFRFTRFASRNVDKDPPDYEGRLSFRRSDVYAVASVTRRRHFPTDGAINTRIESINNAFPISRVLGPSLRVGGRLLGGRHHLWAGYSDLEGFFFLKPFGREVPTEARWLHVGLDGSYPLGADTDLRYRLGHTENRLDRRAGAPDIDLDWAEETRFAELAATRRVGSARLRVGGGLRRVEATSGYTLSDASYTLGTLHGQLSGAVAAHLRSTLGAHLSAAEGDLALSGFAGLRWRPSRRHRLDASIAYSRRLPQQDGRIWFWSDRGYDFLPDHGVETRDDDPIGIAGTLAADAAWSVGIGPEAELRVGGYARRFTGLVLEDQRFRYEPSDRSFSGPVERVGAAEGTVGALELGLRARPARHVRIGLGYRHQDIVAGDEVFRDAWRAVPRDLVRVSFTYAPDRSLTLRTDLMYRSKTEWSDYRDIGTQSGGVYDHRVADALVLDLAALKWFWDKRLRGQIVLRNLLDKRLVYQPIGASLGLALYVQVELVLDTL